MLTRFFQSLHAWVRNLWSRKTRQSGSKQPSGPNPDSRTPARESADEQDRSSDRRSEKASPTNAGSAAVESGDRPSQVFTPKSITPVSDGLEKPPSNSPQDTRSESDSTPAQPNRDRHVPYNNVDVGGSSQPDLGDPALESTEGIEPSEDETPDGNWDSAADKGEVRASKLLPPSPPSLPAGDDGEGRESKPSGPRNIPGRRNGPTRSPSRDNDDSKDKSTFRPKPELICRKANPANPMQWEVVLSAVEECGIMEMRHDGKPLEMANGECSLPSLTGSLSVDREDRKPDELPLFSDTPLIFKLRNNWNGDGRKVGGITRGHYIVIVPIHWSRTGHVPVKAEVCTDTEFRAHYFHVTKGPSEGDIGGFEEYDFPLTDSYFELEGRTVYDDSDEGELFVGAIPKLKTVSGVGWARIGEEKSVGWGKNFKPTDQSLAEVLNGRQGRFYIRVYDDDIKLLDSYEFRYLRDLREICVNDEAYAEGTLLVPPYSEGERTELRFIGENGHNIRPTLPQSIKYAKVCKDDAIILDPYPDADTVSCDLSAGGANSVRLTVLVPRIWWRIEAREESIPAEWRDTPLVRTQPELREHAESNAIIRVRLPRRISSIRVGFGENPDRTFRTLESDEIHDCREIGLQLYHFIDDAVLDPNQPLNEDASLNVQIERTVLKLVRIPVDRTPEIISFTSRPPEITIGEKVTLHWKTRNTALGNVCISPDIGQVRPSGNKEITLYETLQFTLRLEVAGFKEITQSITVKVRPRDDDGKLLTASEIKSRLMGVKDLKSTIAELMADLKFHKQDLERFLEGEFRTGRIRPSDETTDVIRFYEDMSDYACDPKKYRHDAESRKQLRNAATTKRKQKQLFKTDS